MAQALPATKGDTRAGGREKPQQCLAGLRALPAQGRPVPDQHQVAVTALEAGCSSRSGSSIAHRGPAANTASVLPSSGAGPSARQPSSPDALLPALCPATSFFFFFLKAE